MGFIEQLKEKARHDRKTIVLPEGMDRRTYEAAEQIVKAVSYTHLYARFRTVETISLGIEL